MSHPPLVLFDLDHTLLQGDSDQLWCDFLVEQHLVDAEPLMSASRDMERDYKAGTVDVSAFCELYMGTLCLMDAAAWQPLRERFLQQCILPRQLLNSSFRRLSCAISRLKKASASPHRISTGASAFQLGMGSRQVQLENLDA